MLNIDIRILKKDYEIFDYCLLGMLNIDIRIQPKSILAI